MLERIVQGEPLSRILGKREFWGLDFTLSGDTLDPRPETETVVEAVLKRKPRGDAPLRVLDLGTGTGCLLLSLLHEFPMAIGVGLDMADGAVRTAAANAAALGLAHRAFFFVGDWVTALSGRFDLIVTNPPYIATRDLSRLPPEVGHYDPALALDGGEDGLSSYRAIAAGLSKLLVRDGLFVAEVGAGQAGAVAEIISISGLTVDGIEADLASIARCVVARAADTTERKKWLECAAVPSRVTEFGSSVP